MNLSDITFKIDTSTEGVYQHQVYFKDKLIDKIDAIAAKHLWQEIAAKNPLNGIAFIQKIASFGDAEAKDLSSLYQAYRSFLNSRDLQILRDICVKIQTKETTPLVKEMTGYLQALCENQSVESFSEGCKALNKLLPGIATIIQTSLRKVYPEQEVRVPEMQLPHNAFPDLFKFQGNYYACFREAQTHAEHEDLGQIHILKGSYNKESHVWKWQSEAILKDPTYDLRDPKFFVNDEGKLMMIIDGSIINQKDETAFMQPHIAIKEGDHWNLKLAQADKLGQGEKGQWLWRTTWNEHDHCGYSLSYRIDSSPTKSTSSLTLLKTVDGENYEKVTDLACPDLAEPYNEGTIRFKKDGTAVALIRTQRNGLIATSSPESNYTQWQYKVLPFRLGGPNFVISERNQRIWAATRHFFLNEDNTWDFGTVVASMTETELTPLVRLKSGIDNSYPGLVMEEDGSLAVLYYSSEPKSLCNIYITHLLVD